MSARPPNELERKLHQAALADPKKARLSVIQTIVRRLTSIFPGDNHQAVRGDHPRHQDARKRDKLPPRSGPVQDAQGQPGHRVVSRCREELRRGSCTYGPLLLKSTNALQFVNRLTTSSLPVVDELESCTSEVQVSEEFMLDGRRVALIDTRRFDDTNRNDADVLRSITVFRWGGTWGGHLRPSSFGHQVWRFSHQELPNVGGTL